ncbi:methyl-accepting chemotaxis protein [Marinobacter halotolerans]|uniref:methyl-accepting chemotaxis protein n=1 Tax=Marinobacter halotolerans TaxID=1569211 RepID=UPI001245F10A|nr:methyl-accepting chemotaxis protein [Marinobacter halotolerans]
MLKNLKIGTRLGIAFAVVLLLLGAVAILSTERLLTIDDKVNTLAGEKAERLELSNNIIYFAQNASLASLDLLLTNDNTPKAEIDRLYNQIAERDREIKSTLDQLRTLIVTEEDRANIEEITESRQAFIESRGRVFDILQTGNELAATELWMTETRHRLNTYMEHIQHYLVYQDEQITIASEETTEIVETALSAVGILSLLAVIIGVLFAWLITRGIVRPLGTAVSAARSLADGDMTVRIEADSRDETGQLLAAMGDMVRKLSQVISEVRSGADNLASASEEVNATSQSLSQASSEQASSVEETSASMEQMTASISQNTENASITDGMASKAAKEAAEGGEAVAQTVTAMKSIAAKISIIDDIAYQTNLLALNAAIEAARAGEHGKGFAVVAAEVRKLAERSQVAAQEIGEVAGSSVNLAERAGKLLEEMVPSIQKTSDLVQEIAAASSEQSAGVEQINGAMEQLNQITQQNASASEELAATSEEMSSQAEQLQQAMAFFRVNDNATAQPPVKPRHEVAPARGREVVRPARDSEEFDASAYVRF